MLSPVSTRGANKEWPGMAGRVYRGLSEEWNVTLLKDTVQLATPPF